jgi:hypothetical protein
MKKKTPPRGRRVASSNHNPPREQLLAGLGRVLCRSSSSLRLPPCRCSPFPPREQLLTAVVGGAVVVAVVARMNCNEFFR